MLKFLNNKANILEAASQYGTPFYCYDAAILKNTFQQLRNALPTCIDVFYSFKANPNIAIGYALQQLGAGVELCSYYEIIAALKSGYAANNIIFVGPAKTSREIKKCLDLNIYAIVCESITEFKRIADIAGQCHKKARVALRVNLSHMVKSSPLKMGGKPSQFGMDEATIFEHKKYFLNMPNINLVGMHSYNGTRILNAETIVENTQYILDLSRFIQDAWRVNFEMVDIGGGLGVPYFPQENELDMMALASGMQWVIDNYMKKSPTSRIILESGRYLVAKSGVLVSRIIDIKSSKGEEFAITDGGTHCHMAAVGTGTIVKGNFPISAINLQPTTGLEVRKYNITGPLCTPGDLIGRQIALPKLSIGDFILVKNSGAYGPTASPVMFLSYGFPTELLFKNGGLHLIRDRFSASEFIKNQYAIH